MQWLKLREIKKTINQSVHKEFDIMEHFGIIIIDADLSRIDDPDDSQFSAGDINEDDILNIQDIIATINIILDR